MNMTDRSRLARLMSVWNQIPAPCDGGGTQSASIKGMSSFARDMRVVRPMISDCIMAIARCDVEDPDTELERLERWVETRQMENWE